MPIEIAAAEAQYRRRRGDPDAKTNQSANSVAQPARYAWSTKATVFFFPASHVSIARPPASARQKVVQRYSVLSASIGFIAAARSAGR